MIKTQHGYAIGELLLVLIFIACIYGWIMNVIKFVDHINDPMTMLEIIRAFGIPMVPLGIVLGFC